MRRLTTLSLLCLFLDCVADENPSRDCSNIPGPGAQLTKIEQNCKKGDVIMLNKMHVSKLCDFNFAIVSYNQNDQYLCIYLGETRDSRTADF